MRTMLAADRADSGCRVRWHAALTAPRRPKPKPARTPVTAKARSAAQLSDADARAAGAGERHLQLEQAGARHLRLALPLLVAGGGEAGQLRGGASVKHCTVSAKPCRLSEARRLTRRDAGLLDHLGPARLILGDELRQLIGRPAASGQPLLLSSASRTLGGARISFTTPL